MFHAYTLIHPISPVSYRIFSTLHCKEDPSYVFLKVKLRGLVPNFMYL
jgi:hypothetical protein